MAGQRSGGLPLRLHQILSGGRHSSPSLKLESEPPPKVKAFIDRVIKSPLHDIAIPLSGFRWEYNKGNFHHWRPLFLHFETYFRTYLSFRKDLLLSDSISEEDPFPKHSILQILRVMQIILENCQNKSSFSGLEHFKLLLASSDPEILIATLETLSSLVKINPSKIHMNGKLIGCGEINSCLLSLAQGWGSKEEGLGLYSCVMANERSQQEGFSLFPSDVGNQCSGTQYRLGSTLHFEFNISASQDGKNTMERSKSSNLRVIHVPDLHLQREEDLSILKHCVEHYNVPPEHRFSLLTRIRYANSFRSPKTCRLYSRICILAFIVMVQSSDAHDELSSFFANEPEYTNELIRLVQADESVPANVRALSMLALGAQLAAYASSHERARILSGSSIISAGGNRLMLLDVLHKAVLSLSNPCDHSSPLFIDALLQFFLLHVLSSSSSGSAIRSSLMVPPLLSFLQDTDSAHMHLVCSSVKILQKLMEYSGPAVSTFKDLGGVELLTRRLQIEVNRVIGPGDNSSDKMVICDLSKSDEDCFYAQKRLIKTMLKALGSATYSPANASRPQNSHDNTLPSSLAMIFQNATIFGGDIYFSAVTLMSEIIHKDPTCFNALYESGLPTSFLSSVTAGVLPSSRALICVPNGLGAICLNVKGQEEVKETAALRFLVRALTSRKYLVAMNEGVVLLANAVEELFRHVSSLRSTGVDIIIEIITKLAALADHSSRRNENTAMETDADDGVQEGHDLVNVMNSAADGVSNEQFLHLSIFHLMVLVHRTMENTEICRLFVERGGIETLMKLLLRPSITQSSEGMPIALHSTVVFKGFTQHHSAPLARAFSSALRDYIKKAMDGFQSLSYSLLLNPKITSDSGAFSSLFVIEFLLFLAASKDNRWISALLSEFGDTSKDVLEDIGRVHREILWQLALLDDSKPESDIGSYTGVTEAQRVEQAAGESDEQRLPSIRQYIDPLLRRRVSGWSIESQVSDLISIYRDLGRSAGGQQRFGIDGYPTLRLASSSQTQSSGSVDGSDGSRKEKEKERSYYSTCCDMMRSLSYHISHLFMELGKSMLLTSRRENNPVNVSPPIISVGSTISLIVLDHLNFAGHDSPSSSENSLYAKCRYLGKVIDFIDGVILDRPESCNPILVNCFYGRGVIQSILTTFEATSQLLFAVNRVPASPMETDDRSSKQCEKEETDDSWIYGPMASYALLMDHLATSSIILSSSGRQFLEQPLINVTGSYPQNAESFVKILQSKILRTVLPIWTHPRFAECSMEFIGAMISIMKHIYSGVEVRNGNGNSGARISGPPPNESAISLIVEMGFSRSRAEEALRQVGTDSVEIATDWLFSHPEEPQEDDELARALAMSLGSATASKEDETMNSGNAEQEEETISLPPVDDLLSACLKLLQGKEPLAFPVRDLLLVICSQNDEHRSKVLTFIMDHVKSFHVTSESFNGTLLSALFHVLALILHQDAAARELASRSGLVKAALSLLSEWNMDWREDDKSQVPKWVTACFLSIDRMLQVDQKLPSEITDFEQFRKDNLTAQTALAIDGRKKNSQLKVTSGTNLDIDDQKRLLEISCRCIQRHLPSETMHAVLQLCATLTKVHSVAVSFLDAGGLPALLSLPTSSLFPGFNNVAAAIIRHILEDPHTLQQAMELEIRHSLVASANRHSNGRVTPRNFVQNLSFVISRDPVVFMRAAQSVCQIEMVGDRPYVVLLKDREKEKSKERDKTVENDKQLASNGKVVTSDATLMVPGSGLSKTPDSTAKSAKAYKKSPQSFTNVIELLLDSIVTFVPSSNAAQLVNGVPSTPSLADMDIDNAPAKGKGKAIVVSSEDSKTDNQEAASSLAKTVFILKLMTEILLTYASSIHVVLRRDAELSSARGPSRGSSANCNGGIFHHVLHNFLPYPGVLKKDKKVDGDWRQKLASRASHFLVASSIRSAEGRRRIFAEINNLFCEFIDSSNGCRAPDSRMHAFVDLLNDILAARSPSGSYISAEASITFINVGLVRSLSRTLQILDLDQTDSPKVVTGIVKALETVTKEHVHSVESAKGDNSSKLASDQNQQESSYNDGNRFQSLDTASQPDHAEEVADHMETFNAGQTSGGSDSVTDDMDHDRDMDGRFSHEHEDDFMHEAAEDAGSLGNGISAVEITFDIQHNAGDDSGEEDEDEDMSADEGDEVDEDDDEEDEENNDLEEDDVHQLSHPDMDQDDHEMDDDEFDEDVLEEEEEEDDDEDGVILRLEEGVNGMNVFDHIEVLSGSNNLSNETLRVMPLDIFGSRRQGRTTSIYNLLGRSGDHGLPLDHPLLEEPSSLRHLVHQRQSENAVDMAFSDRNHESTSTRLEAIFRSLRSGRHGHRFNMWLDDGQQRGGSTAPAVPQGIEELLVSQLRRPSSSQITDQDASGILPQEIGVPDQVERPDVGVREENPAEVNDNNETMNIPSPISAIGGSGNGTGTDNDDMLHGRDASNASDQVTDMQYERSNATIRDVEAVSQASSGSGATLGESLRSLEVEIGSVDGPDDGERQGPADRLALGDLQASRTRRLLGSAAPISGRDVALESVSEVPSHSQEANQSGLHEEQQVDRTVDPDPIDPTFLEALPEELRAEVLSSRQNQVPQPSNDQSQTAGDIDPEFLAALPPDIREEVLAQQRAQRQHQSRELEGQPVEMDAVSIIATFPSEIREEVLLTSPDTLLATLTPALVAEANMLRERFARRYHNSGLFGMYSRNRRGESSGGGELIGSSMDRAGAAIDSRKSAAGKLIEADGAPLVDTDALKALIRLLRVVQLPYKGQLQRLLLNLCTHQAIRTSLVKILVDMLMLDLRGPAKTSSDAESPFRLYGCQSHVTYSRPQFSNGVPPLVSRRVLETLTYLARNHPNVAKLLLHLELPQSFACVAESSVYGRGKAIMEEDKVEAKKGEFSIVLLFSLLNEPLYMRSIAHLEQLLNLLEVVMINAENDSISSKSGSSPEQQPSGSETAVQGNDTTADVAGSSNGNDIKPSKTGNHSSPSSSLTLNRESSVQAVLLSLPQTELRLLCSLLAREGLSDNAYNLVAEVLKKLVAIAPSYCHLFITELANSLQSLTLLARNELHLYEDSEKALLSTSSSNGTAILRVLQALSSLITAVHEKERPSQLLEKGQADFLSQVWDINTSLESLWSELSNCIGKIENFSETTSDLVSMSGNLASANVGASAPLPAGAQNILPYIESFFVTCEKLRPGQPDTVQDLASTCDVDDGGTSIVGQRPSGICSKIDEKHPVFVKFSEKHRRLLNAFIRQNPGLLEKSFSLMLKIPRLIDFDNKRSHFRSKIKHQHDHHHSPVRISVRRAYILEDSYNQLRMRSPQELKGRLTVHFQGEEGIDAGGLTREWYQLLSRVIFDKGALLFTTVGNESTFQPNPNSVYQTEHLSYFKFVGRVVGKALFDGQLLDVHFTRSFYKHILGVKVTYHDIEAIDPDYFKNLKWMLENDITDVLDLTFSMDADEEKLILYERTEVTDSELIPDGRNIKVTEENKHEYVDRVAEHRLTTAIRPQINAFMEGFNELIPRDLVSIFNDKELELLISGLPDIDLDDLRANTEYSGYSSASPVIQWFWEVLQGFSKEDKARFLQFVTGTSKVPLEGFNALQGISGIQRFQIHKAYGSPDHLPSAHTCFNQLDLPEYASKEKLQERLLLAIHEANEGFGFG